MSTETTNPAADGMHENTGCSIITLCKPAEVRDGYHYIDKNGRMTIWDCDVQFVDDKFRFASSKFDKLCFAIASLCGKSIDDDDNVYEKDDINYVNEKLKEIKHIAATIYPGLKELGFDCFGGESYYGIVENNASRLLEKFLEKQGITLYDFVADGRYIVLFDKSNRWYEKFVAYGIFNEDNIADRYYG